MRVARAARALAVALALAAAPARAQSFPPIGEIAFEGNDTTQPVTLRRELSVHEGDPADPVGPGTPFELGGADSLRGYANHLLAGDSYYYGGIEVLRPLHWDWLRGVAFIESGNTFAEDGRFTLADTYLDAGIGVRARGSSPPAGADASTFGGAPAYEKPTRRQRPGSPAGRSLGAT